MNSNIVIRLFTFLACAFFLSSCDTSSSNATSTPELQHISLPQWQQQLAAYRGEIVVVDLWAMWCQPCIKRFPKMVTLDQQYRERGVQIVGVNLDNMNDEEAVANAQTFITKLNATFDNFHIRENLIDAFNQFGLRGIPVVVIYDRQGQERYRLTGGDPNNQFTEQDIEEAIVSLLAEG